MTDYTGWSLDALTIELVRQAAIHEAAAIERAAVAEEMLARERAAKARAQVDRLSDRDREALRAELERRAGEVRA